MSETADLKKMREPFPSNQISKLPKPTKQQTEEVKTNYQAGVRCKVCGGWHHPKVVHLDYVGHAALTDRLLDVDPEWSWEPLAIGTDGTPVIDKDGGLWIKLTVCGVTRLGYGDAQGKTGGDAMKERIGDALRNAAMRFGAALDLWHKGDLHGDEPVVDFAGSGQAQSAKHSQQTEQLPPTALDKIISGIEWFMEKKKPVAELVDWYTNDESTVVQLKADLNAEELSKANKHYEQVKSAMTPKKTTNQRQNASAASARNLF